MTTTNNNLKKKKQTVINAADFWCGGGGTSTGLVQAVEELGFKLELTAVNHWDIAVATHSKNHILARHLCKSVDSILPNELFPDGKLKLLVASPECIGHSRARGGKPTTEQKRADANDIRRWVERLYIENILLENVEEFVRWGPLGKNGKPLKSKKGEYFRNFIDFLKQTYTVEWRILNCADYGDATTRKRFFLIAKRGKNKKISFPEPTHTSRDVLASLQTGLFDTTEREPWVPARDIINWNLKGINIFGRPKKGKNKELCRNTMRRIFAGLRRYSGIDIPERPIYEVKSLFDLLSREDKKSHSKKKYSQYFSTDFSSKLGKKSELITPAYEVIIRGRGGKIKEHYQFPSKETLEAIRKEKQDPADEIFLRSPIKLDLEKLNIPFTVGVGGAAGQQNPRDINDPMRTITGTRSFAVANPSLVNMKGTERRGRSIDEPTFTQTTSPRQQYLVEAFLVNQKGLQQQMRSIDDPTFTQTAHTSNQYLVQPYFFNMEHQGAGGDKDNTYCYHPERTLPVIAGKGMFGLVEAELKPILTKYHGNETNGHSVDEPVSTITTKDRLAVVRPFAFMLAYHGGNADNGANRNHGVDSPVPTVDTSNRFAVVEPVIIPTNHGANVVRAHSIHDPLKTITAKFDANGIINPHLIKFFGGQHSASLNDPIPTITAQYEHYGLSEPFFIQFYGERDGQDPRTRDVDMPLWTVTPQVRMGIVEPFLVKIEDLKGKEYHGLLLLELGCLLIINFRMLHQKELAAAMSFPKDYYFHGSRNEQVRQIGNAVPVKTAKALCKAILGER